ncbi:MAG: FAD-dependent oxidoreductase [Akkermansia sp.]
MSNTDNLYDMIIVGGGPAGLSAALYMARAKYKTLVLEKEKLGGQITITHEVVNYPGVLKTDGASLTRTMHQQAESFGAEFKIAEVRDIDLSQDIKCIKTSAGEFRSLGVILALGAAPRQIGFEGEQEFRGRGVAYCATCDGEFFQGMPVYVVGGGFAAIEEGIFLTKYAYSVKMLVRGDAFRAAKSVCDAVEAEPKVRVSYHTEIVRLKGGNGGLTSIVLRNNQTGEEYEESHENGFGVFVFAGYVPNTAWLPEGLVELKDGYIVTDANQQTNRAGVYAAGDVCIKNLRQVVTAVSDGAIAATSAEKYVEELHSKLALPAFSMAAAKKAAPQQAAPAQAEEQGDSFLSADIKAQLKSLFAKFESCITVRASVDNSPLAAEMSAFVADLAGVSDKVLTDKQAVPAGESLAPYLEILAHDGTTSGIRYYAMPGGHEFNSFILALYNVAGPGKEIDAGDAARIAELSQPLDLKVLISLSCTMCPELVVASQKIAAMNPHVSASAIDIGHFPDIKQQYKVMSVPCLVINGEQVHFGKKNIIQLLDIIQS